MSLTPRCPRCNGALERHPSLPALWRCMFTLCDRYGCWSLAARAKGSTKGVRETAAYGAFVKAAFDD